MEKMVVQSQELRDLLDNNIPGQVSGIEDCSANLERVAAYCEENYLQSSNKQVAFEETKQMTLQSLASVAYQVNAISTAILRSLDLEADNLTSKTDQVRNMAQLLAIQKEKASRREIGRLTMNKTDVGRQSKIVYPEVETRAPRYQRTPIDYSVLDGIGHGYREPVATQPQRFNSTYMTSGTPGPLNRKGSIASTGSSAYSSSGGIPANNHSHHNYGNKRQQQIYEGHYGHYGSGNAIRVAAINAPNSSTLTRNATVRSSGLPPMAPMCNYHQLPAGSPQQGHYQAFSQMVPAQVPVVSSDYDSGTLTLNSRHYGALAASASVAALNGNVASTSMQSKQHYGTLRGVPAQQHQPSSELGPSLLHQQHSSTGQNYDCGNGNQHTGNNHNLTLNNALLGGDDLSFIDGGQSSTASDYGSSSYQYHQGHHSSSGVAPTGIKTAAFKGHQMPNHHGQSMITNNTANDDDDMQLPPPPPSLPGTQLKLVTGQDIQAGIPRDFIERAQALFDYEAQRPDELNLYPGAVVFVIRKNDDGWYEGVMDGMTGLFPGNYVQRI